MFLLKLVFDVMDLKIKKEEINNIKDTINLNKFIESTSIKNIEIKFCAKLIDKCIKKTCIKFLFLAYITARNRPAENVNNRILIASRFKISPESIGAIR